MDYCDVFINSHSDGTHLLQKTHWWAIDVIINLAKSVLMKNNILLYYFWQEKLKSKNIKYMFCCLSHSIIVFIKMTWKAIKLIITDMHLS